MFHSVYAEPTCAHGPLLQVLLEKGIPMHVHCSSELAFSIKIYSILHDISGCLSRIFPIFFPLQCSSDLMGNESCDIISSESIIDVFTPTN